MKKLFCALLVLMLLPIISFADESPVGCWYFLYDKEKYPEFSENYHDADLVFIIYVFSSDGSISILENYVTGKTGSPTYKTVGFWSTSDSGYQYGIVGFGKGEIFIKDDMLHMQVPDSNYYMELMKITPFDPYDNVYIK